jgi:uncharacterized protein YvpB
MSRLYYSPVVLYLKRFTINIMPNQISRIILQIVIASALVIVNFQPVFADDLPTEAYVTGFVGHPQERALTCEIRSAVDVASFWGVTITEDELFNKIPESKNPETGFVGNPNGVWGNIPPLAYGVHAPPIARVLRKLGLLAKKGRNLEWDDLRAEIAAGRPVIVWIIGSMWAGEPIEYTADDGSQTVVARFEHTMVLTGYTEYQVQVIDAYTGALFTFPKDTFLQSWGVLENQAVMVQGLDCKDCSSTDLSKQVTPVPEYLSKKPKYYIVQPDEYLIQLGERFGMDWRELARINDIQYPWVLYPGQTIKIK